MKNSYQRWNELSEQLENKLIASCDSAVDWMKSVYTERLTDGLVDGGSLETNERNALMRDYYHGCTIHSGLLLVLFFVVQTKQINCAKGTKSNENRRIHTQFLVKCTSWFRSEFKLIAQWLSPCPALSALELWKITHRDSGHTRNCIAKSNKNGFQ